MKISFVFISVLILSSLSFCALAQKNHTTKQLFIDVHQFEPGTVTFDAVAGAHKKDLATEKKYGVDFIKYWVDEKSGMVFCLSSAADSISIAKTHAEAHGLMPSRVYKVTDGSEANAVGATNFFLDIHELGAGNVTAKDVEAAHRKDLAVEGKYGVNFINYWVDEKTGVVICLSEAKDPDSIIQAHKEAHGLLPGKVLKVKQGK